MVANNVEIAEIQAQRAWGDKETIQPGINPDRSRRIGQTSSEDGSQPFSAHRDDRERGNFIEQCGQATLGGIIDRLISKVSEEIEESESRTADLRNDLEELKELSKQFQEKTKQE